MFGQSRGTAAVLAVLVVNLIGVVWFFDTFLNQSLRAGGTRREPAR